MAITGNVGGIAPDVIQRYILNADQYKAEIKDVAKEVRKQKKEEKDLKVVMDAVAKSEKKTTAATERLTRSTRTNTSAMQRQQRQAGSTSKAFGFMTVVAGNLVTQGIALITKSMRDGVKVALDYEDWIGKDTEAIKGMRQASAGLISDLSLMKARTRLLNGDFNLTERELQAVTKAAVQFTRVNKTDFTTSLQKVTDVITRGTSRGMKDLGINVDLLGKSTVKTSEAIGLITDRFADMDIEAANTNERIAQTGNALSNMVGQMGTAILKSKRFIAVLQKIASTAQSILAGFELGEDPARKRGLARGQLEEQIRKRQKILETLNKLRLAKEGRTGFVLAGLRPDPRAGKGDPLKFLRDIKALFKGSTISAQSLTTAIRLQRGELEKLQAQLGLMTAGEIGEAPIPLFKQRKVRTREITPGKGGGARRRKKRPPDIVQQIAGKGELDTFGDIFGEEYTGIPGAPEGGYQFDIAAAGLQKYAGASNAAVAADLARADALRQAGDAQKESIDFLTGQGTPALAQFTGGLWAAADAAIQGGDSMGLAVAKMVKATLLGLAQEATIKAVFYGAEALAAAASLNFPAAAKFGAAAAIMGGVAAGAGTAGLLLSAATAQGGSTGRKKSATSKTAGGTAYRPGFGRTVEPQRAIVLNLYINDPENPTQQVITDAMIQKAALPA